MKRRGFIGMLGATVFAPALPGAAPANINAALAAHVRKYPIITVLGISNRVGVPLDEAEALLRGLARSGAVDPISTGPTGMIRARSAVFKPSPAMMHAADSKRLQAQLKRAHFNRKRLYVRNQDWLAHLRGICDAEGIPLQPRALEYAA